MDKKLVNHLLGDLSQIIEEGKKQLFAQVNRTLALVYWQVGNRINTHILENERAEYGKEIVASVASQLEKLYGRGFSHRNLWRMMQFAELFSDTQIVSTLSAELSWSHFVEILPIKNQQARHYYACKCAEEHWSIRELRHQISRKAFERKEIAKTQFPEDETVVSNSFKDPYFLDFLGLKEGYLENDLESAI